MIYNVIPNFMHQSIPAVPIPPPPPPWANPRASAFFFFFEMGKFSGVGPHKLSKCPGMRTKKEGNCHLTTKKSGSFRKIHYNIISKIALGLRRTYPQPQGTIIGASFRRLLCLSRIKTSYLKWCFVTFYTLARSVLKVASFEFANLQCFI